MRVLTLGVFDYFHLGHLRLFKQCKEHGDYLIVGVQNEDFIKKYKDVTDILYTTKERVELLNSIKEINEVFVYDYVGDEKIKGIDFDVFALGEDHKGKRFDEMIEFCKAHGKKVVRLKRFEGISSSFIKKSLSGRNIYE